MLEEVEASEVFLLLAWPAPTCPDQGCCCCCPSCRRCWSPWPGPPEPWNPCMLRTQLSAANGLQHQFHNHPAFPLLQRPCRAAGPTAANMGRKSHSFSGSQSFVRSPWLQEAGGRPPPGPAVRPPGPPHGEAGPPHLVAAEDRQGGGRPGRLPAQGAVWSGLGGARARDGGAGGQRRHLCQVHRAPLFPRRLVP